MKKVFKANMYFFIVLLLEVVGAYPLAAIIKVLNITDIREMLVLQHVLLLLVPAIIYIVFSKESAREILKLNRLKFVDMLYVILLGICCVPIVTFIGLVSQLVFPNEIGELVSTLSGNSYISLMLLFAVMPAITEEVTVRGVILNGYKNKNVYVAAIMTGLFFGMLHLDGQQFFYAAFLGFIMALVVTMTKSIFASAIIHFIINGTSITLQKLVAIASTSEAMQEASNVSLTDYSAVYLIIIILFYGALAVTFSLAVFYILKRIKDLNVRRGIINDEDFKIKLKSLKLEKSNNERVINIPFVMSVIIYFAYMIAYAY